VEDDVDFCEELAELLEGEGFRCSCISDPAPGEEAIREGGFDTVLLDYKMPAITALDILRRLKADNIRRRIFLITGRPFVERKLTEENLSGLVEGIIPKPLRFEKLLRELEGLEE
jgi:DNA-binding response OmpR family regulator